MKGVVKLYQEFKKHLTSQSGRIAPLQVLGHLEDYLTKEFAGYVITHSGFSPVLNIGKKAEKRRIDLALVEGDISRATDGESFIRTVRAFIEVKYFNNRHRYGYDTAQGEWEPTMKDLQQQLTWEKSRTFAKYDVNLRSCKKDIYGLVFASFVRREDESETKRRNRFLRDKEVFLARIEKLGKQKHLLHYNSKRARLLKVYGDKKIRFLNTGFRASLYAGLWRLDQAEQPKIMATRAASGR